MDWTGVIERNANALRRILVMLVAMAGLEPHTEVQAVGEPRTTLPRRLHCAILALLRPAEAAARRLVIVAAREIVVAQPCPRRRKPVPASIVVRNGKGTGIILPFGVKPEAILPGLAAPRPAPRRATLPLLDPLPRWPQRRRPLAAGVPRISQTGIAEPHRVRRQPMPHDAIDATRLALRLHAVSRVLDDLPGHARRFALWKARTINAAERNKQSCDAGRFTRLWPLRPGRLPGARRRPTHEVHNVLADLQYFAVSALELRPDSS